MAKKGVNIFYLLVIIILCGVVGSIMGEIAGMLIPNGILHTVVAGNRTIGMTSPFEMDLVIFYFSFAFKLRLNLPGLVGLIAGFFIYNSFLKS